MSEKSLITVKVPAIFGHRNQKWVGKTDFTVVGYNANKEPLIRVYDELNQATQERLRDVIVIRTLKEEQEFLVARSLRLAVIQQQYDIRNITELDAKEMLRGFITPDNGSTYYDDSGQLKERSE